MLIRTKTVHLVQQKLKKAYHQVAIDFEQLVGTDFQETLQSFLIEKKVDLLAMITQQRGFYENIFNSSVTQKMSYYTTVPLLSLHKEK